VDRPNESDPARKRGGQELERVAERDEASGYIKS